MANCAPEECRPVVIHWFRRDLRMSDNPALAAAAQCGQVLPIYILEEPLDHADPLGQAAGWWLHHSLEALNQKLAGRLQLFRGDSRQILAQLVARHPVQALYYNRCHEPWQVEQQQRLSDALAQQGVAVHSFNGTLLWEPQQLLKQDGSVYKVFTPFFRNARSQVEPPARPVAAPRQLILYSQTDAQALSVADLKLLDAKAWAEKFKKHWQPGEQGAQQRLKSFLESGLDHYKSGRDFPARRHASRLSASLHFGEISPQQLWYAALDHQPPGEDLSHFHSELGWREFSYTLLQSHPQLAQKNFNAKFDSFPWQHNDELLLSWQRGMTGYPLVDAGMRELWQTGTMHNRLRMVVGSFLVKNLLLHWQHGERWFRDCLLDADSAINSASWQWIAGCGADAAPYFRIFNPVLQGQKFDGDGVYTRHYLPELARLPNRYLFNPWQAPAALLKECGVQLGVNYPKPVVDLKQSRDRALAAYATLSHFSPLIAAEN